MPDSLGPVTIGATEIYNELLRLRLAAERLVDRVDEVGRDVGDHEARLRALEQGDAARALPDHEVRIRAVERRVWSIPSLAAVLAVASLVVTVIDKLKL